MRSFSVCRSLVTVVLLAVVSHSAWALDCVETSPTEAQKAVEDARRAVLTLEYEATLQKLIEVRKSLPCLTGTIPAETIATLYFYQGLMLMNLGREGADEAFRDAAAVAPLLQEDREHETRVREAWAAAREEVTRMTGELVVPNLPSDATVYLNGRPTEVGTEPISVYPGVHLLQVTTEDHRLFGTLLRVRAGETTLVPAEFIAALTPRGELILDVLPRRSHIVVRQGKKVAFDIARSARRQLIPDVKEGAYIVEVERPGYYPFSQAKVAVEGDDQTIITVRLERKPSLGLLVRGGVLWVSAKERTMQPTVSFELIARAANHWAFHLEYVHLMGLDQDPWTEAPAYTDNPNFEEDEHGNWLAGPPAFPNATTDELPLGARMYLGTTRQFSVEGVDFAVGPKVAMDLYRASALAEFSLEYDPVPWVGVNFRAGIGAMGHMSEYVRDKMKQDPMSQYLEIGLLGRVSLGIKGGF